MEFGFSAEEERFRQEVRDFLKKELPEDWYEKSIVADIRGDKETWAIIREFQRKLAAKGWLTLGWPKEYGGPGQAESFMKYTILREEICLYGGWIDPAGVRMLPAPLMMYGTEEQKKKFLGAIARGEVIWCEGFSEPDSGSDLASLKTVAVADGDYYIVNGHKTWTTNAHNADWCFFLARTDPNEPRHKGISFLLVDMKSPGITVSPIINMAGLHDFNEVYFDNVRVPKENLIGEENRGFYVAMALLVFERAGIEYIAYYQRVFDGLLEYVKTHEALAKDPLVRQKIAQLSIELDIGRLITYHIAWMESKGLVPNYEASIQKLFRMELIKKLAKAAMQIVGLYGELAPSCDQAPLLGGIERVYLSFMGRLFGAGTSDVQKRIIALRELGLPKE